MGLANDEDLGVAVQETPVIAEAVIEETPVTAEGVIESPEPVTAPEE